MRRLYAADAVRSRDGMRAGGWYLAAAGFGVAWWVGYIGVLGFRPGRRVEGYDPLRRWWRVGRGVLCHDGCCLNVEENILIMSRHRRHYQCLIGSCLGSSHARACQPYPLLPKRELIDDCVSSLASHALKIHYLQYNPPFSLSG